LTVEPTIRDANIDDVERIAALLRGLAESLGEPQSYRPDTGALVKYGFGSDPVYRTLIAEQDKRDAGLCIFFPEFSTWRCEPGIYVQDLYVAPEFRRRGLGEVMLAEAMRRANAAWDAAYLRLAVHALNRDALRFYQALGFNADPDNRVMLLTGADFHRVMTRAD
jgi:ribosomal protein S18 acetylase RimI-like enzyme